MAEKTKAPRKTATKKAEAPAIAKAEITKFVEINKKRLDLQRQADALKKQEDTLKARMKLFIAANGGKAKSCSLHGFVLALVAKAGQVAWKQEFIRVAGEDAAAAVVAPTYDSLTVTKL